MLKDVQFKRINKIQVTSLDKRYTFEEIKNTAVNMHTVADENTNGIIICLGDSFECFPTDDFEICFPVTKVNFKINGDTNSKLLKSINAVSGVFEGTYDDIPNALTDLKEFAEENGKIVTTPYRIVYRKELTNIANKVFKTFPKYTMEFIVPVQ